ncbi:MAG TPA: ankyrin repeat domain-containing protein [Gemmatimonadaceae bacterium]|nr:ankyrin repeat domain-containing protein [Gemmatimonadaceae bacterium]
MTASQFQTLFRAIAAGDITHIHRLLAADPRLVAEPTPTGASRAEPAAFYLERIEHYVYAGDTALHLAAAAYQTSLACDLLKRGARVDAKNRRGAEPLHYACDGNPGSKRWNPDAQAATIECLLSAGANPNAVDRGGVAPLHRAVRTRCAAAVRILLEHGANVRQSTGRGSTPMDLALRTTGRGGSGSSEARAQQAEIVRLLAGN